MLFYSIIVGMNVSGDVLVVGSMVIVMRNMVGYVYSVCEVLS